MIKYLTKQSSEFMWSSMISNSCSTSGTKRVNLVTNPVISHKREKERIWKYTWSSAIHIFCSDNQVIVAVVELLKRRLQLNQYELLVHESPYSSNHLSRKSLWKSQALEYRINWEISTPYTSAARMLLRINGRSTIRKWNDLVSFVLNMTDKQNVAMSYSLLDETKCRYLSDVAWCHYTISSILYHSRPSFLFMTEDVIYRQYINQSSSSQK
jgi:hypothetical protein